jgi:hypothetical protein
MALPRYSEGGDKRYPPAKIIARLSEGLPLLANGLVKTWGTPELKRTSDFLESHRSIKNTLKKKLLNDYKVESLVGKCLIFKLLAAATSSWISIPKTQL